MSEIIIRLLLANRLAFLLAVTLLCVSCSNDFQDWELRNSVVEGRGGAKTVVDGMDVWTYGDPPRRFIVLGIIQDSRPEALIPMQQKHDIIAKARQSGGDALIKVSSQSQLVGWDTSGSVNAYITTAPVTRHTATLVVIKYL